jgi:hypothetical protein
MPNLCPSCHKFCSLENADPDVNDLSVSDDGTSVTAEVRAVRTSACCGDEIKEFNFSLEDDRSTEIEEHQAKFHEGQDQTYEIEEDSASMDEGGGSRYAKNMITLTLHYVIKCQGEHADKAEAIVGEFDITDAAAASEFDELN